MQQFAGALNEHGQALFVALSVDRPAGVPDRVARKRPMGQDECSARPVKVGHPAAGQAMPEQLVDGRIARLLRRLPGQAAQVLGQQLAVAGMLGIAQGFQARAAASFNLPGQIEDGGVLDQFVDQKLFAPGGGAVQRANDGPAGAGQRIGPVVLADGAVRLDVGLEEQAPAVREGQHAIDGIERHRQRAQLDLPDVQGKDVDQDIAQLLRRFGGPRELKALDALQRRVTHASESPCACAGPWRAPESPRNPRG